MLRLLDGSLDRPGVLAAARRNGVPVPRTQRLLDLLAQGGALDDAAVDTSPLRSLGTLDRRRLAPDLASLSLQRPEPGAALAALTRRQSAAVEVVGAGRVGAPLASHLAAAGVGRIHVDEGTTRAADVTVGGLIRSEVGRPRADAVRATLQRTVETVCTEPLPPGRSPDLVVIAPAGPLPEVVPRALLVAGTPHLFAGVRETTGVVGPLVVPGRSSCLRCADLNRTARDPAWPTLAAQLATPAGPIVDALDGALAAAVAAHAALQVLGFLDGLPAPGTAAADTAPGGGAAVFPTATHARRDTRADAAGLAVAAALVAAAPGLRLPGARRVSGLPGATTARAA